MSDHPFVPAAGSDMMLPFYDPFTWLLGVGRSHRILIDQARIPAGARVLEIGCGTGNLSLRAKRLHPDIKMLGIDPDPKALARARRKAERRGLDVKFEPAYSEDMAFPDASFDRVLSAFMLHHVHGDSRLQALQQVRRVLKPDGSLHLADFIREPHARGGLLARFVHGRPPSHLQHSALATLREAGFAEALEVGRQRTLLGEVAYLRASMLPLSPSAAA